MCRFDASLRYFDPLDQIVRSPRCIEPIHVDRMCRFAQAQVRLSTCASGCRFPLVRWALLANTSKSGLGSRPVPTYAGEYDVKAIRGGLRAGPPGHARVRAL